EIGEAARREHALLAFVEGAIGGAERVARETLFGGERLLGDVGGAALGLLEGGRRDAAKRCAIDDGAIGAERDVKAVQARHGVAQLEALLAERRPEAI